MTGGAEPASSAAESKEIFVITVGTFYSGEALMKITALKIFSHHMRDYQAVESILLLEKFVIALFKINKMTIQ